MCTSSLLFYGWFKLEANKNAMYIQQCGFALMIKIDVCWEMFKTS
jgi:hypothetical protein